VSATGEWVEEGDWCSVQSLKQLDDGVRVAVDGAIPAEFDDHLMKCESILVGQ
jgi:hypothetical protein